VAQEAGRRSLRRRRAGEGAGCGTPGASRGSLRRRRAGTGAGCGRDESRRRAAGGSGRRGRAGARGAARRRGVAGGVACGAVSGAAGGPNFADGGERAGREHERGSTGEGATARG